MNSKWVSPVILIGIILAFIIAKWSSLFLPYFWDEAWSYIPAIHTMANQVPCLIPGCIDTELYRGHPMLFYFMSSAWMKWISSSIFSMHVFAMLISLLAVISFYRLSKFLLPVSWALFSTAALVMQQAFFVQSSFVLPEVLIMLLTTEAALSFLKNERWRFIVSIILLTLTKETGIIIGIGFFLSSLFIKKQSYRQIIGVYALAFLPCLIFYLVQKIKFGWFFYPLHQDLTDLSFTTIKVKAGIILHFLFIDQGRKILIPVLSLLAIIYFWQKIKSRYVVSVALALLAVVSYFFENAFLCLLQLVILGVMFWGKGYKNHAVTQFIGLSCILSVLVISFSSINFLMLRYLLVLFPFFLLLIFIVLQKILPSRTVILPAAGLLLVIHALLSFHYTFYKKGWHDDVSINYVNMVKVHEDIASFLEENNLHDKKLFTHFLMYYYLTRKETGYLNSSAPFKNVRHDGQILPDDEVIIISGIEYNESLHESVRKDPGYKILKRLQVHQAWTEVYQRQH